MHRKLRDLFSTSERFRDTVLAAALVLSTVGLGMMMIGLFLIKP